MLALQPRLSDGDGDSALTDRLLAIYGTAEPLDEEVRLTAGPIDAIYAGGALRNIRLQGVEVIRGLYFLIRDRNWATVVPEVCDLKIDRSKDSFRISFEAHGTTPSDNLTLVWRGHIEGSVEAGVVFSATATPDSDFHTCRTGFIILHPLDKVVGCPVRIEHTDGTVDDTVFPDLVDPIQSFFDVRVMTHEPLPGIKATCRMDGGAWETEDHRNWLDASFKTYFRPLALPWPYIVAKGTRIEQKVSLSFAPSIAGLQPVPDSSDIQLVIGDRTGGHMPAIGVAVAPEELDASLAAAAVARDLAVQSMALRIASDHPDLPGVLRKGAQLARALDVGTVLEIVVAGRAPPAIELDLVAVAAAAAGFEPSAVVVSPEIDLHSYSPSVDRPGSAPLHEIYLAAGSAFPGLPIGGGMYSYFTELNRRRPPPHLLDFVQHATASIVHAADDRSVMETLESLPHVFRSARAFMGDMPYRVGPSSIGMAFNPYGASTTPNPNALKRTMATDDPRHKALFGAAWTVGFLARAAAAGIDTVTIGAPAGPFGLVSDGNPVPAFHVMKGFAGLAGAATVQTASSNPQEILAAAAERAGGREVWIANLTPAQRMVRLSGVRPSQIDVLDADSGGKPAAREVRPDRTLELAAYAVARITG
ncbi:MAG: hypothetical protein M3N38_08095 [Pseudomonadota bacterium]|nr:hypothetical protein [Pseudomonadota bacterium]